MITYAIDNYSELVKYAYQIFRLPKKSEICELSAKNVIFTPINKSFIQKFKHEMVKTHKFALETTNGMYCALCDYDFHKTFLEE